MKKTILIPVETSSRELIYKVYLCNLLAINGFECFLGNKHEIYNLIKIKTSFIYLDKGYHQGVSEKIYNEISRKNGYIVNLDEEGAVAFPDGSPLHLRYSKTALSAFNLTLFWGVSQMKMVENLIPNKNFAIVTGHPRFQLLKKEFKYLYKDDVNEIKEKFGKYILINTNFARANNIKGVEKARENYIGRYKNIDSRINNDNIKIKIFSSLIYKLAQLNYNIVIRPHPEEKISTYNKLFKSYSNVYIINKKSAIPWIIASETLIHSDCTTAVESLMLGKKSISYIHKDLDQSVLTVLPQKASYVFENEKQILDFIKYEKYKEKVDLKKYKWLNTNFNYSKNSFELILNALNKINFDELSLNKSVGSYYFIYRRLRYFINRILNRKNDLIIQKLQDFNFNNINKLQRKLEKNNELFNLVSVKKIINNLYVFRN